jgi:hypothetical protein
MTDHTAAIAAAEARLAAANAEAADLRTKLADEHRAANEDPDPVNPDDEGTQATAEDDRAAALRRFGTATPSASPQADRRCRWRGRCRARLRLERRHGGGPPPVQQAVTVDERGSLRAGGHPQGPSDAAPWRGPLSRRRRGPPTGLAYQSRHADRFAALGIDLAELLGDTAGRRSA